MKILVVDDELDICEILQYNLETEGYEVDTVNSAEEALARGGTGAEFDGIRTDSSGCDDGEHVGIPNGA